MCPSDFVNQIIMFEATAVKDSDPENCCRVLQFSKTLKGGMVTGPDTGEKIEILEDIWKIDPTKEESQFLGELSNWPFWPSYDLQKNRLGVHYANLGEGKKKITWGDGPGRKDIMKNMLPIRVRLGFITRIIDICDKTAPTVTYDNVIVPIAIRAEVDWDIDLIITWDENKREPTGGEKLTTFGLRRKVVMEK